MATDLELNSVEAEFLRLLDKLPAADRRRAEEVLKEIYRMRNESLAVLSHELRNPLAAIPFAVELLRPVAAHSADAKSALEVIDRQTQEITKLVDDLVAQLGVHKLELNPQREGLISNQ
jgi:signal transduction histidine kinase